MSLSSHIRLVLVAPKYDGNIGASVRAAANFDVEDVRIVAPQCPVDGRLAQLFATGESAQLLKKVQVAESLGEALAGCQGAVAVTRRTAQFGPQEVAFTQLPSWLQERRQSGQARIALVFGREDNCLLKDEVQLCSHILSLPTSPKMPTMNLSHAVAVVLCQAALSSISQASQETRSDESFAPIESFEGLMDHWRQVLIDLGFVSGGDPERILKKLRRLLQRMGPAEKDVSLLRAVLSRIQTQLGTRSTRSRRRGEAED